MPELFVHGVLQLFGDVPEAERNDQRTEQAVSRGRVGRLPEFVQRADLGGGSRGALADLHVPDRSGCGDVRVECRDRDEVLDA